MQTPEMLNDNKPSCSFEDCWVIGFNCGNFHSRPKAWLAESWAHFLTATEVPAPQKTGTGYCQ